MRQPVSGFEYGRELRRVVGAGPRVQVALGRRQLRVAHHVLHRDEVELLIARLPKVWRRSWKRRTRSPPSSGRGRSGSGPRCGRAARRRAGRRRGRRGRGSRSASADRLRAPPRAWSASGTDRERRDLVLDSWPAEIARETMTVPASKSTSDQRRAQQLADAAGRCSAATTKSDASCSLIRCHSRSVSSEKTEFA